LQNHGLVNLRRAYWNLPTPALYEESIFRSEGSLSHLGPLVVNTGKHTARAAADKFVVREQSTEDKIWWGQYNRPVYQRKFQRPADAPAGLLAGPRRFRAGLLRGRRPRVQPAHSHHHAEGLAQPCLRAPCS
jgi:ATP-dependent phosphoenolpyruvate carboxykinase